MIEWPQQCNDYRLHGGAHRGVIFCTGWIASDHVSRLDGQDYAAIPRVGLHPEPQRWPTRLRMGVTAMTPDHYYSLLDGGPIVPPSGVVWLSGMGSLYG